MFYVCVCVGKVVIILALIIRGKRKSHANSKCTTAKGCAGQGWQSECLYMCVYVCPHTQLV